MVPMAQADAIRMSVMIWDAVPGYRPAVEGRAPGTLWVPSPTWNVALSGGL